MASDMVKYGLCFTNFSTAIWHKVDVHRRERGTNVCAARYHKIMIFCLMKMC